MIMMFRICSPAQILKIPAEPPATLFRILRVFKVATVRKNGEIAHYMGVPTAIHIR
jgi:hypothetical protein